MKDFRSPVRLGLLQWVFLSLSIAGLLSLTAVRKTIKDDGSVGDVVYSILEPATFYDTHDQKKWALLDGRSIEGTALSTLGVHKIPDARGLFVRAMDMGRYSLDGNGDPDWKTRNVVDPQVDGIKSHHHNFNDSYFSEINCGNRKFLGSHSSDGDNGPCTFPSATDDGVGMITETRPKNVALYVYIKINN